MIPARSVGAVRASRPAYSPAPLPQQGIGLQNTGGALLSSAKGAIFFPRSKSFLVPFAQGLTNFMAST